MQKSLEFYTRVLGFIPKYPEAHPPVIDIVNGESEIQLSTLDGDGEFGTAVNVLVDDVDAVYREIIARGLVTTDREDSPVHRRPVRQTWGMREFYVDDPDGNTIRFRQPIS